MLSSGIRRQCSGRNYFAMGPRAIQNDYLAVILMYQKMRVGRSGFLIPDRMLTPTKVKRYTNGFPFSRNSRSSFTVLPVTS
jgi:hypothetical protein